MGYRNPEIPNPLNLFQPSTDPAAWNTERLHQMVRHGNGHPIFRPEQLDEVYDALVEEPSLRLEYDRFLPEIPRRSAD